MTILPFGSTDFHAIDHAADHATRDLELRVVELIQSHAVDVAGERQRFQLVRHFVVRVLIGGRRPYAELEARAVGVAFAGEVDAHISITGYTVMPPAAIVFAMPASLVAPHSLNTSLRYIFACNCESCNAGVEMSYAPPSLLCPFAP